MLMVEGAGVYGGFVIKRDVGISDWASSFMSANNKVVMNVKALSAFK
jgi:hypothetical protein